jgi:hypothetical protein
MKAGDLIRVVIGSTRLHPPTLGQTGVILGPFRNAQAPHQKWFHVYVGHRALKMHESYLAVINESR